MKKVKAKSNQKKPKVLTPDQELLKKPTVLIEEPNLIFTDRLGNILKPGSMICYAIGSRLKIGVFVGLLERSYRGYDYEQVSVHPTSSNHWSNWKRVPKVYRKQFVTFSMLDRSGTQRNFYEEFKRDKYPNGMKLSKFIMIQQPEFIVNDPTIGKCFSLIDNLKDSWLKDYVDEDDENFSELE